MARPTPSRLEEEETIPVPGSVRFPELAPLVDDLFRQVSTAH